jgi:hypothetical protein
MSLSFCAEPVKQLGGKAINDAINIHTSKPVQPATKLLDNWFNGNSTRVNVVPRAKAAVHMMMPM